MAVRAGAADWLLTAERERRSVRLDRHRSGLAARAIAVLTTAVLAIAVLATAVLTTAVLTTTFANLFRSPSHYAAALIANCYRRMNIFACQLASIYMSNFTPSKGAR